MTELKRFIIPLVVMLVVDALYLSSISKFFGKVISDVQKSPMTLKLPGAVACYLFLGLGLYYFIIKRNTKKNNRQSVIDAFILGLVIYGVFETTNYALLKNWSVNAVIIDSVWGGILFAITTYISVNYLL